MSGKHTGRPKRSKTGEIIKKNKAPELHKLPGRPRKEFNQEEFEKLCKMGCTGQEIEDFMEISVDVICKRCNEIYGCDFTEIRKRLGSHAKISVRRAQLQIAQKNAAMAIWLGKHLLDQKDVRHIEGLDNVEDIFDSDRDITK